MRQKSVKGSGIPDFSSDEEAFEWYESHEITDHLEDTEEVLSGSIFYQDARGQWLRASDGSLVNIVKGKVRDIEYVPQGLGRIIDEYSHMCMPVTVLEIPTLQQRIPTYTQEGDNFIIEGDNVICRLTTLSSATMLKLKTR